MSQSQRSYYISELKRIGVYQSYMAKSSAAGLRALMQQERNRLLTPTEKAHKSAGELGSLASELSRIADCFPNSPMSERLKAIAFDVEVAASDLKAIQPKD